MAGLIRALFGGRSRPPDPDPLPGQGGYQLPPGRTGEGGYPGSTSLTRTFGGNNPRAVGIRADHDSGWESGPGTTSTEQQAAYRGDVAGSAVRGPRSTGTVRVPQGRIRQLMQQDPGQFYGGMMLRTGPGNNTVGGNPLAEAAGAGGHSRMDTQTPVTRRQPVIGVGTPGSNNVRNGYALRYKARPGDGHSYQSASRPDQAPVNRRGQNSDGSVKPWQVSSPVTVPSRFVFPGGGVLTYFMLRQMPYAGRGDGARGAALNGQRFYTTGQADQFVNAGMGDYGIERARGSGRKRPVSFTMPAPWSVNVYDTTDSVGTESQPGAAGQQPSAVYISPQTGRASNSTGRTG